MYTLEQENAKAPYNLLKLHIAFNCENIELPHARMQMFSKVS